MPSLQLLDRARWPAQAKALRQAAAGKLSTPNKLASCLSQTSHAECDPSCFDGLMELFDEARPLLPSIAALALEAPSLFETPLHHLPQGQQGSVSLTRRQAACMLSLAFFDVVGPDEASEGWDMPDLLTFRHWYDEDDPEPEKIRCLLCYFDAMREEVPAADAPATIRIERLVLPPAEAAAGAAAWTACDETPLLPLRVVERGAIEEAAGALQADFANEYIGGGVMGGGNVQEEIRFVVSPECLVSLALCPRMLPHEALLLTGVRQYSVYTGYGGSFACAGRCADPSDGAHVIALDATCYMFGDNGGAATQYREAAMVRELTKCWAALSDRGAGSSPDGDGLAAVAPSPRRSGRRRDANGAAASAVSASAAGPAAAVAPRAFATGNWGCGVFGGDPSLKALLQWMAASRAGREIAYYPFGDARVAHLGRVAAQLLEARATVGQLASAIFAQASGGGGGGGLERRGANAVVEAAFAGSKKRGSAAPAASSSGSSKRRK